MNIFIYFQGKSQKVMLISWVQQDNSSRQDGKNGNPLGNYEPTLFTDGSKIGARVFKEKLNLAHSYRFLDKSRAFQVEMLAIWKTCDLKTHKTYRGEERMSSIMSLDSHL